MWPRSAIRAAISTTAPTFFRIHYAVDGVLDPGSTGVNKQFASSVGDAKGPSAFYWNVIAPAWNNQIEQADISITLPGKVNEVGCSVGAVSAGVRRAGRHR